MEVTRIRRSSEGHSLADAAQSSGVYTTGGWLDWSDRPDINLQQNADNDLRTLPGWAENSDRTGANYHIRYRHNKNTRANILIVDGHAETVFNGQMRPRNLAVAC